MTIDVEKKAIQDVYHTPIVQQTAFWSEVKQQQGVVSNAFDFKVKNGDIYTNIGGRSYTQADFLILLQSLNQEYTMAYVPYGPEVEPSEECQGRFLEELSEILRSYLPRKCIAIRYDLNWQSHWNKEDDYDETGRWIGPPEKRYQEFHLNYNTILWNLKRANSDILPSNTVFLDLRPDEDVLLSRMRPKTRYNIHLSERKGIRVRRVGMEELPIWYALYQDTARRNGIFLNDMDYFHTVLTARADNTASPAQVELLLAELDGEPLAAMFLVLSEHRGTYLYGASSSFQRNCMPTYALQWEAMKIARASGCTEYDMFGVAPGPDPSHPMYGLYKFKMGFGGELYHQMGCWDYPLDKERYALFQASEMNSQGYHLH